jgi:Bacterial SH3 domain
MKDKSSTSTITISAVAILLLVVSALSGCGKPIGEQFSSIIKALNRAPTATALPPTAPPATAEPAPTAVPPTPVPPTPTATPRPTLTPTLTPSVTPTPGPDAVVTADALTLRGGPGTAYARIGTLRKGDPLTVTARTKAGDWLAVTTKGGKSGWVAAAYVDLNVPPERIPIAAEVPPTPAPPPTSTPTQPPTQPPVEPLSEPPPAESPVTPAPLAAAPTSGPSVDDEIAKIDRGEHGELPQPAVVGGVAAEGEAELTILNDTPYELTVLIGSPNQTTVTVETCLTCSTYGIVGPLCYQEEGRPRQAIRVKPGTMNVAARVDNPSVIPLSGEWTLNTDSAYSYCFVIVPR